MAEESKEDCEPHIQLERLREGDPEEFEKLYRKYAKKLYAYAWEMLGNVEDAEEVTQDVFSVTWKQKEKLQTEFFVWKVLKNKCIDQIRKSRPTFLPVLLEDTLIAENSAEKEMIQEEQKQKWLAKLSEGEQQVLSLLLRGFLRQEIATILQNPLGTVDSRLHRIKEKLKGETL